MSLSTLRLFREDGSEIMLPAGSWLFIQCSVQPIGGATHLERAIDGSLVDLSDPAFRLYGLEISCSQRKIPPISDLWPGDLVTVHVPQVLSQPGPTCYLAREPVPGSIRAIDAEDRTLATPTGRMISVPGAVAVEYRPVMRCRVTARSQDAAELQATAGWSLSLEEAGPVEEEEDEVSLTLAVMPARTLAAGEEVSEGLDGYLATEGLTQPVVWSATGLPAWLSLDPATGELTGTVPEESTEERVVLDVVVTAAAGVVSDSQRLPWVVQYPAQSVQLMPLEPFELENGQPVSISLASLTLATAPVRWEILQGPSWLSIVDGALTGTTPGGGYEIATVIVSAVIAGTPRMDMQAYVFVVGAAGSSDTTVWAIATGGTVTDYTDEDGASWREHDFVATSSLACSAAGEAEVAVIGGGGGGGANDGAGGGGGGIVFAKVLLRAVSYPVVIGAGGAPGALGASDGLHRHGAPGTASSFGALTAPGGGGGLGPSNINPAGRQNGSSGGGQRNLDKWTVGTAIAWAGYHGGAAGHLDAVKPDLPGGGGGAGGPGGAGAGNKAGSGGLGVSLGVIGRPDLIVCCGGPGASNFTGEHGVPAPGGAAHNASGAPNSGCGGGGSYGAGGSGRVIVRYRRY